jgi:4-alpha-glucanotransferase
MSTLRGWWEEDACQTRRFFHTELGHGEDCPSVATAELCAEVVQRHLEAPSLLTVLAWQDWLSIDENLRYPNPHAERINIPANPHHYWCYRMHITLEDLMEQSAFNERLSSLITASGRA